MLALVQPAQSARIQINLRHPGIVRVLTATTRSEVLALVMEYIEGRTLADVIGREMGPIPTERALPLMRQILAALEHAHDQGVIHRDIKPSNILVAEDGTVKVMDFGIAKVVHGADLTRTSSTLGTAAYMSPEQIRGARDVDVRSDIYSVGVTFYEMLAGRTPFDTEGVPFADNDYRIKDAHVNKPPPDPREFYPAIPAAVVAVLMKALAKSPEERYQVVGQMTGALEAAVQKEPGRAQQAAPVAARRKRRKRRKKPGPSPTARRWRAAGAVFFGVVLLIVAFAVSISNSGEDEAAEEGPPPGIVKSPEEPSKEEPAADARAETPPAEQAGKSKRGPEKPKDASSPPSIVGRWYFRDKGDPWAFVRFTSHGSSFRGKFLKILAPNPKERITSVRCVGRKVIVKSRFFGKKGGTARTILRLNSSGNRLTGWSVVDGDRRRVVGIRK